MVQRLSLGEVSLTKVAFVQIGYISALLVDDVLNFLCCLAGGLQLVVIGIHSERTFFAEVEREVILKDVPQEGAEGGTSRAASTRFFPITDFLCPQLHPVFHSGEIRLQ